MNEPTHCEISLGIIRQWNEHDKAKMVNVEPYVITFGGHTLDSSSTI
jgi:hypothetical protein